MPATAHTIVRAAPSSPDAICLIDALSDTLSRITGDSGRSSFDPAEAAGPGACFVLARLPSGVAAGCGALRPLSASVAEVKRMFARPGTRGIGSAILAHLEREAARLGYAALWLSTRVVNTGAVQFYRRHGFAPIAPYGKYIGNPDAICLGKTLGPEAAGGMQDSPATCP